MVSLYHRATPSQARILRAVEGAVKNAADAHPEWEFNSYIARSIAKRAAGTLTAQWPDVLAARSVPSDSDEEESCVSSRPASSLTWCKQAGKGTSEVSKRSGRGASQAIRRSPLPSLWKHLSIMCGQAKYAGQNERAETLIKVLRLVASMQEKK